MRKGVKSIVKHFCNTFPKSIVKHFCNTFPKSIIKFCLLLPILENQTIQYP